MVTIEKIHELAGSCENENILRVLHRHWFNVASHFFVMGFVAVMLFLGFFLNTALFGDVMGGNEKLPLFIESVFFVFLWIAGFLTWIDVWFDVWVITNDRIVNIEQKGLFSREISEVSFSKVQDVTSTVTGLIPSILNYGDVFIQSAGATERFHFRNVPDPVAVKDIIMRLSHAAKEDDMEDAVELLDEMKREKKIGNTRSDTPHFQ